jgi:uncharacterized protein YecE (DUF72 family)
VSLEPYAADALVRFGTSSFSSEDWVGPFYRPGTPPGAFLEAYSHSFDTVEVDATYYAVPSPRVVDGWVAKTPAGFRLAAKFPRQVVHGGEGETPDPRRVLDPGATYEVRDQFLETIARLGERLGTLVLQFPYFNRECFPSSGPFVERLDRFLADLPREGFQFAVEVRNRSWITRSFVDLLRRRRASLVLVDQAWMPHADELEPKIELVTAEPVYVRLLGDRKEIEALTTRWDREVLDRGERLARWAAFLGRLARRGVRSLVYVNNHYAGHAPTTVRRLKEAFAAEMGRT